MTHGVVTGLVVAQDDDGLAAVEAAEVAAPEFDSLRSREPVAEAFALHTCHRAELYVVTADQTAGRALVEEFAVPRSTVLDHEESLRHLLSVAAGLESMVLGEDQVLGQVRDAYHDARKSGGVGPVLEDALTKAIHVGERARTETAINEGVVSLGTAAVQLAQRHATVAEGTALVVGAGEMGSLAASALADVAGRVVVANRTVERAEALADELPCAADAVGLDALPEALREADVAVTATASAEPVVDEAVASAAGETLVVDLGRPRDVAAAAATTGAEVDGDAGTAGGPFAVYDYEDLAAVTDRTHNRRRAAAAEVEAIVDAEFDRLLEGFKRKRADEVVAAMYESAESVKRREVETAISQLEARGELTDEQRDAVESMADALVSQLLAAPTRSLRNAAAEDDWATISTALRLFDPNFEELPVGVDVDALAGADAADDSAPAFGSSTASGGDAPGPAMPDPDLLEGDLDDQIVVPEEYPEDARYPGGTIDADD